MNTVKFDQIRERTNRLELRGNLTADPELIPVGKGSKTMIRIAVSQPVKIEGQPDSQEVLFIDADYRGTKKDDILKFLKKGAPVFVSGVMRQDRWEKAGVKGSKVSMVCFDVAEVSFEKASKPLTGYPRVVTFEELKSIVDFANTLSLMGNLTTDAELRYTEKGTAITQFSLAQNRKFKSATGEPKEETYFFKVTQMGEKALESAKLKLGDPAFVEGKLNMDEWVSKRTGKNKTQLNVRAFEISLVDFQKRRDEKVSEEAPVESESARY